MKQNTIKYIKFVGDEAEKFNANIKEVALKEQVEFENKVNNTDNGDFDPEQEGFDELLELLGDRDGLV